MIYDANGTLRVTWSDGNDAIATFAETLSTVLVYYPYRQGEGIDIDNVIRYSEMSEVSGALGLPLKSITLQTVT